MLAGLLVFLKWLLAVPVLLGSVPLVVASWQFLLIAAHFRRQHYRECRPYFPRTVVLVPAWNEAGVLGPAIDRLMALEYPPSALRVHVVDDASTDATPAVIRAKAAQYPGRVVHLRRERGGQGKAATLNHGLRAALRDDWMQAVLIMDADVIYEPAALRLMARHLADPRVGSVTAYIKEGSRPGSYLTRFIGYEYITAQAAARRSQDVLGVIACLAGGAQLHSRESIETIGGQIDTTTLAEDTVTTLELQRAGRRVIFEPHATVWAEEPGSVTGLWKQRLRWARGNLQVTRKFRHVWFRRQPGSRLGGVTFGLLWFCVLLLPALMVCASASLVALYFVDYQLAWDAVHALWLTSVITYLFVTLYALMIDPQAGRRTWVEAFLFPGAVNVAILAAAVVTGPLHALGITLLSTLGLRLTPAWVHAAVLFTYIWLAACMGVAYLAKVAEPRPLGGVVSRILIYLGGYGPLLCAVTFAAYLRELTGAESGWDKTEKTGKVTAPA